MYELDLGLELETYLSKIIYFNASCGAGLSYRDIRFDFPINFPKSLGSNIGGVALLKFGMGFKF